MTHPFAEQDEHSAYEGYVCHNDHVMSKYEAEAYNKYTVQINRERHPATREFLLDQRHRLYVAICDETPRKSTCLPIPREEVIS